MCTQVAEEVETQLQRYKSAVDEINAKTAGSGGADGEGAVIDHEELLRRNTQNLMTAVSSLPELQVPWMHTAAASRLVNLLGQLDGPLRLQNNVFTCLLLQCSAHADDTAVQMSVVVVLPCLYQVLWGGGKRQVFMATMLERLSQCTHHVWLRSMHSAGCQGVCRKLYWSLESAPGLHLPRLYVTTCYFLVTHCVAVTHVFHYYILMLFNACCPPGKEEGA